MNVISRAEAKAAGLKRYFTGKPCRYGHIAERYIVGHRCWECTTARNRAWKRHNPEKAAELTKAWHKHNTDKVRAYKTTWRKSNPEKVRECTRAWQKSNLEKVARYAAAWRKRHPEKAAECTMVWRKRNHKKVVELALAWRKNNPGRVSAIHAARHCAKMKRTPRWADRDAILAVFVEARRLSMETGVPHHVDHEIPLQGKLVSGLHIHTNLRAIPAAENIRKHNKFEVAA